MSSVKAKESAQVNKARKKIKRQLEAGEKRINPESLKVMREIIEKQIARHQLERVDLKERLVTLFDENKHPVQTKSRFILRLLGELKKGSKKDLEGRIKQI